MHLTLIKKYFAAGDRHVKLKFVHEVKQLYKNLLE